MLLLKHMRNYSFEELSHEVRANLIYREFTRVGGGKTPDDKSMGRLVRQLRPEVIRQIHARAVAMAQEEKIVRGRRMRVDTTVVETNIHYPNRQQPIGRWRARADARHEEDRRHRGKSGGQTARPQPERQAARAGYRAGGALESSAEPGETQASVRPTAGFRRSEGA
jgi:hypothetical protein